MQNEQRKPGVLFWVVAIVALVVGVAGGKVVATILMGALR